MNNMNFTPNFTYPNVDGDTYVGKDSDERIRSPRASIVSLNQDEGGKPLGAGFSPGPFDGEYQHCG